MRFKSEHCTYCSYIQKGSGIGYTERPSLGEEFPEQCSSQNCNPPGRHLSLHVSTLKPPRQTLSFRMMIISKREIDPNPDSADLLYYTIGWKTYTKPPSPSPIYPLPLNIHSHHDTTLARFSPAASSPIVNPMMGKYLRNKFPKSQNKVSVHFHFIEFEGRGDVKIY